MSYPLPHQKLTLQKLSCKSTLSTESASHPLLQDSQKMQKFHNALLSWYFSHGRLTLPWRNLTGQVQTPPLSLAHIKRPYGVYISEMMLQQTQVSVVLERFYFPFLQTFPTLNSIATSTEEAILKAWQGLGYYSRARNIRKAAITCQELYNGELPPSREKLKKLAGIGEYSSGAIACFGFGENVSFVDGNIARIISRLFALPQASIKELEQIAQLLLNHSDSFNHNQALLDFGATLCTPKNPNCLFCPLSSFCLGKASPLLYPTPKSRQIHPLHLHLIFFKQNGKISLHKSQTKLYQGLYNPLIFNSLQDIQGAKLIGRFTHHYTKYTITADVYLCKTESLKQLKNTDLQSLLIHSNLPKNSSDQPSMTLEHLEFFTLDEITSLPISNLCKKALECLQTN